MDSPAEMDVLSLELAVSGEVFVMPRLAQMKRKLSVGRVDLVVQWPCTKGASLGPTQQLPIPQFVALKLVMSTTVSYQVMYQEPVAVMRQQASCAPEQRHVSCTLNRGAFVALTLVHA